MSVDYRNDLTIPNKLLDTSRPTIGAQELADTVGLHFNTVYRHIAKGTLKARTIGRRKVITRDEALRWYLSEPPVIPRGAENRHAAA